jgi:hypothetical protein
MEIITGVERRRRWSAAEKLRIVAETEQPGAGIAETARRHEISRGRKPSSPYQPRCLPGRLILDNEFYQY